MYRIFKDGNSIDLLNIDELRNKREEYNLWIDVPRREFYEKKLGELNLLSKRILGRLLTFLIINANEAFTPTELFEHVWCLEPNGLNEDVTVRTNISRLRNIIEPSHPNWKYIKKTESSFLSGKGAYFFDGDSNYCLILKKDLVLQFM